MSLSIEKTKILLILVNQGISRFVVERDKLALIVKSEESFALVSKAFNEKFSACINLQNMAATVIDDEAIDTMSTQHFNIIIRLINDEIDTLEELTSTLISTDPQGAVVANADIRDHIAVLREISLDLLRMFDYL